MDLLSLPTSVNIPEAHQNSISHPTTGFVYVPEGARVSLTSLLPQPDPPLLPDGAPSQALSSARAHPAAARLPPPPAPDAGPWTPAAPEARPVDPAGAGEATEMAAWARQPGQWEHGGCCPEQERKAAAAAAAPSGCTKRW